MFGTDFVNNLEKKRFNLQVFKHTEKLLIGVYNVCRLSILFINGISFLKGAAKFKLFLPQLK